MNTMRPIILITSLLLGGCEALGGAAGALGVQALTLGGQGVVSAIEEDIKETREDRARRKAIVAVIMQSCLAHAGSLDVWEDKKAIFNECLKLSDDNQHALLIERLKMRLDKAKVPK